MATFALDGTLIQANKLVLELVESEKITTCELIYKFIEKVKSIGYKIAIDDFGSVYSNFKYLVKIDGSIIKRILDDESSLEIVKSMLNFSKKVGIKTIAEFISSKELQEKVSSLGIDYSL
ncbi:EAL domain-containing protein [Arcobacter sp. CECT 8985]|uniref:EAL domain-containing protein n=1 Tax=Arcobacter sp. CECT 8985 TaxID=1935424 RepID=UPI002159C55F|nr:EAL domain-containing protein [Arcobacter sp. CECT 8985]